MPNNLFNRKAEVIIGIDKGQEALSVEGLRVTFDIKKMQTIMPNTGKIEIYNLAESTRNKITDVKSWVLVRAGYEEDIGVQDIYKGVILRVSHQKRPPDVVTTIEALDRISVAGSPRISLGYPENTSAKRILNDVIRQLGLSRKSSSIDVEDRIYKMGFSTVGYASDALTRVTKFLGLTWSIQNQEIKLIPIDGYDAASPVLISAETGMIEAPLKVMNVAPPIDLANVGGGLVAKMSSSGSIQFMKPGWRLKTLLRPELEPKSRIIIESSDKSASGEFTIETITHNGDTTGGDWSSTLEVYASPSKDGVTSPQSKRSIGATRDF